MKERKLCGILDFKWHHTINRDVMKRLGLSRSNVEYKDIPEIGQGKDQWAFLSLSFAEEWYLLIYNTSQIHVLHDFIYNWHPV